MPMLHPLRQHNAAFEEPHLTLLEVMMTPSLAGVT
jgi:hypothetical protein